MTITGTSITPAIALLIEKYEVTKRVADFYDASVDNALEMHLDDIANEMRIRAVEWREELEAQLTILSMKFCVSTNARTAKFLSDNFNIGK